MDCKFCRDKEIQARTVFKNESVMAFPTNIPITPGHILVCPIRHVSKIDQLSAGELEDIKNLIVRLKSVLQKSLGAEGFNIAWNEGLSAGQSVDHFHIHIVPRQTGDTGIYDYEPRQFLYRPGSRSTSPEQELLDIAELIKKSLG